MSWQRNILALSLLAAVVFLPISMVACHTALGVYMIVWMSEGQWKKKYDILVSNPLIWAYIIFFILNVIGVWYSEDAMNGWFNVEKKISFLLIPVALATTLNLDKSSVQMVFKGFILTCVLATLYCLLVAFEHSLIIEQQNNFNEPSLSLYQQLNPNAGRPWMFFSYIELASGIGIHPTYLALYLVFCILLLFHLYAPSFAHYPMIKKVAITILFLYLEIIIVLLSSRILIIAFAVISVFGLRYMVVQMQARRVYQVFILTAMLSPLFAVILINPVSRYRNIQEPSFYETYVSTDGLYEFSTGIRKSLWWLGINTILEVNPIIGTGPGDVTTAVRNMSHRTGEHNVMNTYDPHNQFMYTQIALGLIGLTILMSCLYTPAWLAWRQRNYFYLGFVLLITLVCSTESVLESQKGVVFFAIFNPLLVFQYAGLRTVQFKQLAYG